MDKFIKIGDAAKKLGVCVKTVAKLIDNGQLKGTRVAGGKHRRIRLQDFLSFCRRNAIDVEGVPKPPGPILDEIDYRRGAIESIGHLLSRYEFTGDDFEFVSRYLETLTRAAKSNDPKYSGSRYLEEVFKELVEVPNEGEEDEAVDISF